MDITKLIGSFCNYAKAPPKHNNYFIKGKATPVTGLDRHCGFQEFEGPRFHDNQHMKVKVNMMEQVLDIPSQESKSK